MTAQIAPCPAGHTYQHLGTYLRALHHAFWAAHATCEAPEPELVGEMEENHA
jgi:hypothetical protein